MEIEEVFEQKVDIMVANVRLNDKLMEIEIQITSF